MVRGVSIEVSLFLCGYERGACDGIIKEGALRQCNARNACRTRWRREVLEMVRCSGRRFVRGRREVGVRFIIDGCIIRLRWSGEREREERIERVCSKEREVEKRWLSGGGSGGG